MSLKKKVTAISLLATASLLSVSSMAKSINPKELKQTLSQKGDIEGIQELPVEN